MLVRVGHSEFQWLPPQCLQGFGGYPVRLLLIFLPGGVVVFLSIFLSFFVVVVNAVVVNAVAATVGPLVVRVMTTHLSARP